MDSKLKKSSKICYNKLEGDERVFSPNPARMTYIVVRLR
jgi:hypothetical protein